MKIFKAIMERLRGADRKAANALQDTKVEAENALEDLDKQEKGFRQNIKENLASNKGLERQRDEAKSDIDKWQLIATKAAKADDIDNARKALEKKAAATKRFTTLDSTVKSNNTLIRKCRTQLDTLKDRREALESGVDSLVIREKSAKLQQNLTKGFESDNSALEKIAELEERVQNEEDKAAAALELSEDSEDSLENLYSGDSSVDDDLAALMDSTKK